MPSFSSWCISYSSRTSLKVTRRSLCICGGWSFLELEMPLFPEFIRSTKFNVRFETYRLTFLSFHLVSRLCFFLQKAFRKLRLSFIISHLPVLHRDLSAYRPDDVYVVGFSTLNLKYLFTWLKGRSQIFNQTICCLFRSPGLHSFINFFDIFPKTMSKIMISLSP